MIANEAPKKIYLYPSDRAGEEYEDEWGTFPWGEDYVEYTRTDAFIEKACDWLKNNTYSVFVQSCSPFDAVEWFVKHFKQAMEGGEA